MTIEQIGILLAILGNVATVIGILIVYVKSKQDTSERLARIELMATTLWDFHLRRAGAEIVRKDLGTLNSPLKIRPDVLNWYKTLEVELRSFYAKFGRYDMSDRELAISIESNFGQKILKEICLPNKINQGECLLIAVAVAKGTDLVDLPDDPSIKAGFESLDVDPSTEADKPKPEGV